MPQKSISSVDLKALAPQGNPTILSALASQLGKLLAAYDIATPLRVAHFMAQAAHETDGFRTLVEYGGEAYFDKNYGPGSRAGKRLGNTQPGDGARFRGRGIFQCTGRDNYRFYGRKLGLDLVAQPTLAADAVTSIKIACEYWNARGCSPLADRDDIEGITRKINGGQNGLADRKAYLDRAKLIFSEVDLGGLTAAAPPANEPVPDAAIATEPAPRASTSPEMITTGATAAGGVLAALQGLSGPVAYAVAGLLVIGFAVAAFYIVKRVRSSPA